MITPLPNHPTTKPPIYRLTCLVQHNDPDTQDHRCYIYGICFLNGDGSETELIAGAQARFPGCTVSDVRIWDGGTLDRAIQLHIQEVKNVPERS